MADDILTRNAAGELEVRTVATTGDTGTNKDDIYTRDSQGRLAVRISGSGGGGGGGASVAADVSYNPSGDEIITANNVQSALSQLDDETAKLVKDSSILTTWINMTEWVGAETDIALRDMQIIDGLDSRPSYKDVGAVVINSGQRIIGIIDRINKHVPDEWDETGFADHAIVKTIFAATQINTNEFAKSIIWENNYYGQKTPWESNNERKIVLKAHTSFWEGKYYIYLKTCRKATNADNTSLATNIQTKFIDIITRFDFEIDSEGNVINQKASLVSPLAGSDWQNPITVTQNCDGLGFARLEDASGYIFSSCKGNSVFSTDFFMNATDGDEREIFAWSPIMDEFDSTVASFDEWYLESNIWNAPEGGAELFQSVPVGLPVIKGIGDYATGQGAIYGDFGEGKILQFQDNLFFNRASAAAQDPYFGGAHVLVVRATILRYDQDTGQYSYAIVEFSPFPEKVEAKVIDATGEFANVNWEFAFKWYSNFSVGGLTPYGLEVKPTSIFLSWTGNANGYRIGGYITDFYDYTANPAMRFPVTPLRVSETTLLGDEGDINVLPQCGGMALISGVKNVGTVQAGVAEGNIVIYLPFPMDTITDESTGEETFRKYHPQISIMTDGTFKQIIADIGELRADSFDVCLRNIDTEAAYDVRISWSVLAKVPRNKWW